MMNLKKIKLMQIARLSLHTGPAVCLACAAVLISAGAAAQTNAAALRDFQASRDAALQAPGVTQIPGSLIVKFSDQATRGQTDTILAAAGASRIKDYSLVPGLTHIRVPEAAADRVMAALRRNPLVEYIDLDYVVRSGQSVTANDTYFGLQWALLNTGQSINGVQGTKGADIRATEAWSMSTGGPNCMVAVIDSGIQLNHPDLLSNIWRNTAESSNGLDNDGNGYVDDLYGWDFVSNDNSPTDENGHGTHVAGSVAAVSNNNTGVAGIAWECKLMALRFLDANGSGTTTAAISALEYAVLNGARVSNNSWGGGGYSSSLYQAIKNAGELYGHLFVAAAGNSGTDSDSKPGYPAAYDLPNIISVAATDNRDRLASFSNYGAKSVDIGAPGVDIASTYINNGYVYMNGTSMAAPHVAGTAGLIANLYPHATVQDMVLLLLGSARPLSSLAGKTTTGGMLDAFASLQNAEALLAASPVQQKPDPEPETAPLAATNLTAVNNRNSTATLQWQDNADNETGFVLEREKRSGGGRWSGYSEINLSEDVQTYIDKSGTGTYRYRIRAFNSAGSSPATDWVIIEVTRR